MPEDYPFIVNAMATVNQKYPYAKSKEILGLKGRYDVYGFYGKNAKTGEETWLHLLGRGTLREAWEEAADLVVSGKEPSVR